MQKSLILLVFLGSLTSCADRERLNCPPTKNKALSSVTASSTPESMAELDAQQINILSSMLLTLSGGLIGLLAGNGLKDKPKDPPA